ncbi:hypothetical protein Mmc1_1155 [Magnetococcus marinus MC-1]|uniref:Polysaccharide deacetylase n=1 Tax=Magnetococcus marinus (strain ATCC BAA-1437 / JCM 17883 / MC-1) TaxID=156889 RepID=A0L6S3_MAGMM|nr:hypothetical protein [Magnetococcus marinus]ABK43666.1 hypothetical protein Mmc1_1155 [Magnetococcus marinus MC-1]
MSIALFLSADYELYFSRNLLPEHEVLVGPTQALLQACEAVAAPLTLFCDVAMLHTYRQWGEEAFVQGVEAQLRGAVQRGHDVQLHLHPHWFRTQRGVDGRLHFAPKDYLLGRYESDASQRFASILAMISQGKAYLESLLKPVNAHYECLAFRGGGYGLQPHSEEILGALQRCGLVVDSSVVPGYRLHTQVHQVDFTKLVGRSNQWYGAALGLSAPCGAGQGLFEVPIGSADLAQVADWNPWPESLQRVWSMLRYGGPAEPLRGEPVGWVSKPPVAFLQRPKQAWWDFNAVRNSRFAKLEMQRYPQRMQAVLKGHLAREAPYEGCHYLSINSHPKGMHAPHRAALQRFVRQLKATYGADIDFPTFATLAKQLRQAG